MAYYRDAKGRVDREPAIVWSDGRWHRHQRQLLSARAVWRLGRSDLSESECERTQE